MNDNNPKNKGELFVFHQSLINGPIETSLGQEWIRQGQIMGPVQLLMVRVIHIIYMV